MSPSSVRRVRYVSRSRLLAQSREDFLAVVADVWAEERQELDDNLVLDLRRYLPWPSRLLAGSCESLQQVSGRLEPGDEPPVRGVLSSRISALSPLPFVIRRELAIRNRTPFDQSLAEYEAERMS